MWFLSLIACWQPLETGPNGMVADVVDAAGAPVAGIDVSTLEEHVLTDAAGRFAIQYKPPEQYVDFAVKGARFRRTYQPADDGKIPKIVLPERFDVRFACAPKATCVRPQLKWDLGESLSAHADPGCERPVVLDSVPTKAPELSCGSGAGVLTVSDGLWMVEDAPKPLRIEVRGDEGRDPGTCEVAVGGKRVEGPPYIVAVSGVVTVSAFCDGRAAMPKTVAGEESVTLDWSPTGPTFDLSRVGATNTPLTLVLEGEKGFVVTVPADPEGRYALPPLPPGHYRLTNGEPSALALIQPPPDAAPDVLHVLSKKEGTITAILVLTLGLEDGSPPTDG